MGHKLLLLLKIDDPTGASVVHGVYIYICIHIYTFIIIIHIIHKHTDTHTHTVISNSKYIANILGHLF